jgi:hypothetical protein
MRIPVKVFLMTAVTLWDAAGRAKAPTQPPDPAMTVPVADRTAETARLSTLGLHVPDGGVVLERPWDEPFTRRSLVVPQAWFHPVSPDGDVLADDLAKDLPVLEQVMSRAYGGWDAAKMRGWNWKGWFSKWRASLMEHSGQRLALADAFAPIKSLLNFQLDNHTNIPLSRAVYWGSGSQSLVVEGQANGSCTQLKTGSGNVLPLDPKDPAQHVRDVKRWNAKSGALEPARYISVPGNRGDLSAIQCGRNWLALKAAWPGRLQLGPEVESVMKSRVKPVLALARATRDEPDFKLLGADVAYVRLPTFTKTNTQLIEQRAGKWPKPTGKERVLIVDLRDNDGGDVAVEALDGWLDDADMKRVRAAFNVHRHQGASCLYHALRWGYVIGSSQGVKPPLGEELTRQMQGSIEDLFQPSPPGCPRAFDDSHGGWDYRQHRMQAPGPVSGQRRILVLINNGTGSDGEMMTMLLAALPQTVIAGTNTYGVAQYIQPGYSVLPHTRLPFRIALGTSDNYGDNRSFDGYGFDVDVLLADQDDSSPESILSLARYLGG